MTPPNFKDGVYLISWLVPPEIIRQFYKNPASKNDAASNSFFKPELVLIETDDVGGSTSITHLNGIKIPFNKTIYDRMGSITFVG